MTNLDSILKSRDITLPTKVCIIKALVFPVATYGGSWAPKNWCFWIMVLEKTLECPLDCKEIKPVNTKGYQPWIFIGRIVAEAPTLWPPDAKSQLTGKIPHAGEDWRQKGMTEDEKVGWHHWLNGHEFEQAPEDGEGQGSLAWGHKVRNDWATGQQHKTEEGLLVDFPYAVNEIYWILPIFKTLTDVCG